MARVNIEDDLESHQEFWNLVQLAGGDRDRALGMLVRFFRIAQKAFGRDTLIAPNELERAGLASMIESGWAIAVAEGYEAKGAEKQFEWYRQRVSAGRTRSSGARDDHGRYVKTPPAETSEPPAEVQRTPAPIQPLTLTPTLKTKKTRSAGTEIANATPPKSEGAGGKLISEYILAYRRRYGETTRPEITGKTAGQVKQLLKAVTIDRAIQLVQVYLQMDDRWFETKCHDFGTFVENLTKVGLALDTGHTPSGVNWEKVFGSENERPVLP